MFYLLVTLFLAGAAPSCAASQPLYSFIGSWKNISGSDAEEIRFEKDGTFYSYLHERPFEEGNWEVQGSSLILTFKGLDKVMIYKKWKYKKNILTLYRDGGKSKWKRT